MNPTRQQLINWVNAEMDPDKLAKFLADLIDGPLSSAVAAVADGFDAPLDDADVNTFAHILADHLIAKETGK